MNLREDAREQLSGILFWETCEDMSLKQIIIVDEDGAKVMIRSSLVDFETERIENSKSHIEINIRKPLDLILRQLVEEEWRKVKDFGARLVTRKAGAKRDSWLAGSLIPFVLWLLFIVFWGR